MRSAAFSTTAALRTASRVRHSADINRTSDPAMTRPRQVPDSCVTARPGRSAASVDRLVWTHRDKAASRFLVGSDAIDTINTTIAFAQTIS